MIESQVSRSPDETKSIAEKFCAHLLHNPHSIVILQGQPGAGKTIFTKGLGRGLGIQETINSPTFNLKNSYRGSLGILNHYDLYRIQNLEELHSLGFADDWTASDNESACHIDVIEWGDRALPYITDSARLFMVSIDLDETDDEKRLLRFATRHGGQFVPGY